MGLVVFRGSILSQTMHWSSVLP